MIKFKKLVHRLHAKIGTVHVGLPLLEVLEPVARVSANITQEVVEFISLQRQTEVDTVVEGTYCRLEIYPLIQFRNGVVPSIVGNYDFLKRDNLGEVTMGFANNLARFGLSEDSIVKRVDILVKDARLQCPDFEVSPLLREVFITFHCG